MNRFPDVIRMKKSILSFVSSFRNFGENVLCANRLVPRAEFDQCCVFEHRYSARVYCKIFRANNKLFKHMREDICASLHNRIRYWEFIPRIWKPEKASELICKDYTEEIEWKGERKRESERERRDRWKKRRGRRKKNDDGMKESKKLWPLLIRSKAELHKCVESFGLPYTWHSVLAIDARR